MSQEVRQNLHEKTQKLLNGSLKYVRAAALAAVLVPLASVAVVPMSAQDPCPSGGVCNPPPAEDQPGTGTPGYWKNHPAAWPVSTITVGGVEYTKAQALVWLANPGKDKTTTMFSSLVPAKLNALIGNDSTCVDGDIISGDQWMATYGPVGSNVAGAAAAWVTGQPVHMRLDSYNNGLLCAPHRQ
jgi:hypothetical protein